MTNIWDATEYLGALWSLWTQLRAAREMGTVCQQLDITLGGPGLFDAADSAAYDTIMNKVKTEGLSILSEGGTRLLTPDDIAPMYPGWLE